MHEPVIRSGDHILVGDGRKALLLENCGNALSPRFQVIQQMEKEADGELTGRLVGDLKRRRDRGKIERLHVVAPPRTLGSLREAMPENLRRCVVSEIDKDLTGHSVRAIERNLRQAS